MRKLLKYLKSYTDAGALQYFEIEKLKTTSDASLELYQLTNYELQKILAIANSDRKLKVFIVEDNPLKFLAAFMAGVIAEVDLFLCDRAWQQNEWQQVLSLAKPDLILGKPTIEINTINSLNGNLQSNLPDRPLIMIPTGGTSGKIRFAMHSWETLSASVRSFQEYFDCENINSFCTLPLYHVSGLMQFMRSFITEGNLVLCPYKAVQTEFNIDTREYFISLVPTQLQLLIESIPDWLSRFKTVLLGGAPATRSLLETARKHHISIAPTYGMTETASGVVTLKPSDFLAGNNSSGRVLPHARVTIKPIDNIGSIAISGASLCLGYYPQLFTSTTLVTDDLGYFDRDGYLHLVGRNSHKIITGGENVFPAEVEAAIFTTGLVMDVCVIGISDRQWGQAVTAIYVPVADFDLEEVKQQIRSQLANYKQPKKWIKLDRLPRNNRGKINYQRLKAIAKGAANNN